MKREQGFSITEMLISTTLFLVVLGATLGALSDSLRLNEKTNRMADLEQNLRAGANFVVQDFIQAGWQIPTGGIPIPSGAGAIAVSRPSPPQQNFTFNDVTISAVNPGAGLGPAINGRNTDMVNILYGDNLWQIPLNSRNLDAINGTGSLITVNPAVPITNVNYPISVGDLIYFNNAKGSTIQYVTAVNNQQITLAPGDPMGLNQPNAAQGSITQLKNGATWPPTTAMRVWMVTYYLDSTTDPQTPRLIRRINNRQGQVVGLVLEDLQLTYDLVDGLTNPTNVDNPVAPNSPNQIRKLNLFISGRSAAKMRETNQYLHHTLTTQVSLRSLAFVSRYK